MKQLLLASFILSAFYSFNQVNNETKVGSLSGSTSPDEVKSRQIPSSSIPTGTAILNKQVKASGYQYTFTTNRDFDETVKERWEHRFPISFPYIIDFTMNVNRQEVILTIPSDHTEEELLKLIKRFGYVDYQFD